MIIERLHILQNKLPHTPTEIHVLIDGREICFPLFNYILRASFWRPRDIIKNFAIIIKLQKSPQDTQTFAESIIKKYLVKSARDIIENEFIHEYQNVFLNIKEVVNRFYGMDMIQEYSTFCEVLSKIPIRVTNNQEYVDSESKIKLLYRLGIIGLMSNNDYLQKEYGYPICYIFNEGMAPLDDMLSPERKHAGFSIIFNPIFAKYLCLTYNTKEPICNFAWEYICTNHQLKDQIRRI